MYINNIIILIDLILNESTATINKLCKKYIKSIIVYSKIMSQVYICESEYIYTHFSFKKKFHLFLVKFHITALKLNTFKKTIKLYYYHHLLN